MFLTNTHVIFEYVTMVTGTVVGISMWMAVSIFITRIATTRVSCVTETVAKTMDISVIHCKLQRSAGKIWTDVLKMHYFYSKILICRKDDSRTTAGDSWMPISFMCACDSCHPWALPILQHAKDMHIVYG